MQLSGTGSQRHTASVGRPRLPRGEVRSHIEILTHDGREEEKSHIDAITPMPQCKKADSPMSTLGKSRIIPRTSCLVAPHPSQICYRLILMSQAPDSCSWQQHSKATRLLHRVRHFMHFMHASAETPGSHSSFLFCGVSRVNPFVQSIHFVPRRASLARQDPEARRTYLAVCLSVCLQ